MANFNNSNSPASSVNAYILLSGGQDSFVCTAWSLKNFKKVEAISINYGQRHGKELKYAKKIASYYSIPHFTYSLNGFFSLLGESSLINKTGDHYQKHALAQHLPSSFVPNRNGLFLTLASNHAFRKGEKLIHLVTGTCQTDFSGYPDCRDAYIKAKSVELSLGLDSPVSIHTPLMWKNKAETFQMAFKERHLDALLDITLTCYEGVEKKNNWGRGCGECPACHLRKEGYEQFVSQN